MLACFPSVLKDTELDFHIYKINVLDSIQTELTYEQGVLVEVRHTKRGSENYVMNTYGFNPDGSISAVYRVKGDTILEIIFYYPNNQISEIIRIKELNPHSIKFTYHGFQEEYYKNGKLKEKYKCIDGKLEDTLLQYNIKGQLRFLEIYKEGKCLKKVDTGIE